MDWWLDQGVDGFKCRMKRLHKCMYIRLNGKSITQHLKIELQSKAYKKNSVLCKLIIYELKDKKMWEFSAQNGVYHELFECAKNTVLCKLMNYKLKTKTKVGIFSSKWGLIIMNYLSASTCRPFHQTFYLWFLVVFFPAWFCCWVSCWIVYLRNLGNNVMVSWLYINRQDYRVKVITKLRHEFRIVDQSTFSIMKIIEEGIGQYSIQKVNFRTRWC